MSEFVNLTPHAVVIVNGPPSIQPSGTVARCSTTVTDAGTYAGVYLQRTVYGSVEGLPPPRDGVLYIVSALVRAAVPDRTDVASPGELVRDSNGAVVGCRSLVIN